MKYSLRKSMNIIEKRHTSHPFSLTSFQKRTLQYQTTKHIALVVQDLESHARRHLVADTLAQSLYL